MQKVIHFVLPIVGFCIIGCTDTSYLVGTYAGLIGLDDGDVRVSLQLNQGGNAELEGLSDKRMEGTWYLEKVGEGRKMESGFPLNCPSIECVLNSNRSKWI